MSCPVALTEPPDNGSVATVSACRYPRGLAALCRAALLGRVFVLGSMRVNADWAVPHPHTSTSSRGSFGSSITGAPAAIQLPAWRIAQTVRAARLHRGRRGDRNPTPPAAPYRQSPRPTPLRPLIEAPQEVADASVSPAATGTRSSAVSTKTPSVSASVNAGLGICVLCTALTTTGWMSQDAANRAPTWLLTRPSCGPFQLHRCRSSR